jgi:hypothetical protein
MFCHQRKHYHTHGFLFILSLVAAFLLGRKSEQYGYTIVSRGCGCLDSEEEGEMGSMNDSPAGNTYSN